MTMARAAGEVGRALRWDRVEAEYQLPPYRCASDAIGRAQT
jgi:hypothetical protein